METTKGNFKSLNGGETIRPKKNLKGTPIWKYQNWPERVNKFYYANPLLSKIY
jgi:hypothetical protein